MDPELFSTEALHPRDQFEAWREWHASVIALVPKSGMVDKFPAKVRMWKLGGLAMSWTSAPRVLVQRTRRHLRLNPIDHWVISYCLQGTYTATTSDVTIEVPARVPFLSSLGQDYVHERTGVDRIQIFLARDAFHGLAPLLDSSLGSTLQTPLGRLFGDYITALMRHLPDVTDSDFTGISNSVAAMIAAAVAPSRSRAVVARGQLDLGRKERVRQAIHRHLRTPTLEPKSLGRLVGMSRSSLYRLFEDAGGLGRYIQRERLLEARNALSDPTSTQSISTIAEDLCFSDASSFARAFKREFGCSPSDIRYAAVCELPLDLTQKGPERSPGDNFGDFLRGF